MKIVALLLSILLLSAGSWAQQYARFFTEKTMRVDYYHTGTKGVEYFSLDEVIEEGSWPGSKINLVDTLNLGEYMFRVFDVETHQLIFSRGFSSIFNEWQTTDEALAGKYRTFSESVRFPFPKRKVHLTIHRRDKQMEFHEVWGVTVDPGDPLSVNKKSEGYSFAVSRLMGSGNSAERVDIVIVGDGYTKKEMEKFRRDAKHFNDVMFSIEPFKSSRGDFNVWLVEAESEDSGIDIPDKSVWRRNILGTRYSTFGVPRYVLTTENKRLRDVVAAAPYDFVCILLNDTRYGGGGIYNLYATTYTGEQTKGQEWQMDYVYVHEFGHSFAGLGDEYYGSTTAYNDFYSPGVEPWEPNVTALTDKQSLKWKSFLKPGTPLPTPWNKRAYDSLETERGKLDRLAADYYERREPIFKAQAEILKDPAVAGIVGAFEGAGYASKGLYRPSVDCMMFTLSVSGFDPVCTAAINRVISFYSK